MRPVTRPCRLHGRPWPSPLVATATPGVRGTRSRRTRCRSRAARPGPAPPAPAHSPSSQVDRLEPHRRRRPAVVAAAPGRGDHGRRDQRSGYGHYVVVDHGERRVHALRPPRRGRRRRRPARRPGRPARHRRGDRQLARHRTCTSRRSPGGPSSPPGSPALPFSVRRRDVGQLRRRPGRRQLHRRRRRRGRRLPPGEAVHLRRPRPGRAPPGSCRSAARSTSRSSGDWDGDGASQRRRPRRRRRRSSSSQTPAGDPQGRLRHPLATARSRRLERRRDGRDRRLPAVRRPRSTSGPPDGTPAPVVARRRRRPAGDRRLERRPASPTSGSSTRPPRPSRLRLVDAEGQVVDRRRCSSARRGDLPVTGDWDGNGITDLGVWSPGHGDVRRRAGPRRWPRRPRASAMEPTTIRFGRPRR